MIQMLVCTHGRRGTIAASRILSSAATVRTFLPVPHHMPMPQQQQQPKPPAT